MQNKEIANHIEEIIKHESEVIEAIRHQLQAKFPTSWNDYVLEVYKKINKPIKFEYLVNYIEQKYTRYSTEKSDYKDNSKISTYYSILEYIEVLRKQL